MYLRHTFLTLIFIALSACSSTPEKPYDQLAGNDKETETNPQVLYERTAALFSRPENLGLDFYSPTYYQSAVSALRDAEQALNNPREGQVSPISASIAARKLLEKAQQVRTDVDRNLRNLVKHRNLLVELEASKWRSKEWKEVSDEIKDVIILVENGKVKRALSQESKVREDMYTLEINTLLASSLDLARKTLNKADQAEADIYAPYYFNSADILIDDTKIYIRSNYRDRKGIERRANTAYLEALRAYKTALDARQISDLNNEDLERYIIAVKAKLDDTLKAYEDEAIMPGTIDEKLSLIFNRSQTVAQAADTTTAINDHAHNEEELEDPKIEVLEVLDSLYLDEQDSEDTFEYDEEQAFDEVQFAE